MGLILHHLGVGSKMTLSDGVCYPDMVRYSSCPAAHLLIVRTVAVLGRGEDVR